MKTRLEARTKGYIGTLLSGERLTPIAQQIYELQYGEFINCQVDDLLFVQLHNDENGNKRYALICEEGVGWESDEFGTIAVPTNIGAFNLWNGRVHISVKVIKDHLAMHSTYGTEIRIDIAEYVRVFGDRLDNNVALWQSRMIK
jgi:hypothetical protein